MPADESLAYYWVSIGFSAAGVAVFLWLLRMPGRKKQAPDQERESGSRSRIGSGAAVPGENGRRSADKLKIETET